jgi:hypothetical protein
MEYTEQLKKQQKLEWGNGHGFPASAPPPDAKGQNYFPFAIGR